MSEFSADWLALREPADHRARADELLSVLQRSGAAQRQDVARQVLDLGAGTGANVRHLAPRLGPGQHWRCVDRDDGLLGRLAEATQAWTLLEGHLCERDGDAIRLGGTVWDAEVQLEPLDLARSLSGLRLPPSGGLVTASALLDLVSTDWLATLIRRCHDAQVGLLFVLSYDGKTSLSPAHPLDAQVLALFNRHQRSDKGFGNALGPDAPEAAQQLAKAAGYRSVRLAASDWVIGPAEAPLQRALVSGWAEAARAVADATTPAVHEWRSARFAQIAQRRLSVRVGHRDLVATPA